MERRQFSPVKTELISIPLKDEAPPKQKSPHATPHGIPQSIGKSHPFAFKQHLIFMIIRTAVSVNPNYSCPIIITVSPELRER